MINLSRSVIWNMKSQTIGQALASAPVTMVWAPI
jgi:hypothetical protein